jgi:putative cardiolipin synthase
MLLLQFIGALFLFLITAGIVIRLRHPLPPLDPRAPSVYLTDTGDTPLGRGTASARAKHPGRSGVHMLANGREAFAARVLLARAAVRSLDIQCYIWQGDLSGTLMLEAMHEAADRGVRVRMLLDDNGIAGLDPVLAALNLHPNIEIRLFNPFVVRHPKLIGYLADFPRLNRRMHNKSFTADNQATIIGGRNIGDEYFGARDEALFSDMDVLAIGPVVEDVSRDFDRYWSSRSAYPADRILPAAPAGNLKALVRQTSLVERDPAARVYMEAIRALPFIEQMLAGSLPFEWAAIRMISDDPAKGLGDIDKEKRLATALYEAIGRPEREVRLISGYFVPTRAGTEAFSELAASGVDVSIFTNAFAATDVWIVHAGYAERRKALLRAGIRLFEMRGPEGNERPRRKLVGAGSGGSGSAKGHVLRSSGSILHAKTFTVDNHRLFIGSFNFDPRSIHLNTELGFVIESPRLAAAVSRAFETDIPMRAYEVALTDYGRLNWREQGPDGTVIHATEPGTSTFQRWGIRILSCLPIEWLL